MKRRTTIGSVRWVSEWWTWAPGHGGESEECADHFLEECVTYHSRAFPSRALAERHTRDAWNLPRANYARMVQQEWTVPDGCVRPEWEQVGEVIEVDPPTSAHVEPKP